MLHRPAPELPIRRLHGAVRAFENGVDATDDLTVMAVRYLG